MEAAEGGNRFEEFYSGLKPKLTGPISFFDKVSLQAGRALLLLLALFALLEIASFLAIQAYSAFGHSSTSISQLYKGSPFIQDYQKEESAIADARYSPYVDYVMKEADGKYMHINASGIRATDNPCAGNGKPLRIFFFGGSTAWGTYARDNGTIPSYLSRALCAKNIPVEVTNFGQGGYVSTQELIALMLQAKAGNAPDYAIFYDGVNDAMYAYVDNQPGAPSDLQGRESEFNLRKRFNIAAPFFYQTNTGKILRFAFGANEGDVLGIKRSDAEVESLSSGAASAYIGNLEVADALSKEYNFTVLHFLQPNLFTKKTLSDDERKLAEADRSLEPIYAQTYRKILDSPQRLQYKYYDLTGIFGNESGAMYFDTCHIPEEGNGQVAAAIAEKLYPELVGKNGG